MRRIWCALLLVVAACSSDTANHGVPKPGDLAVTLAHGGTDDGAMLVVVSGGPVTSVDAPAGYDIATNTDSTGTHIMIMGNVTTGAIATLHVPDVSIASAYTVTLVQVADRATYALLDPAPYVVTVGAAP